jgi:hypothetical protein
MRCWRWGPGSRPHLRLDAVPFAIHRAQDIVPIFEALNGRAEGLYVALDPLVNTHMVRGDRRATPTLLARADEVIE